jgi:hypothetical protein
MLQVQELQPAVRVLLRDRDHEPQVRLDQLALGLARALSSHRDLFEGRARLLERGARLRLELLDPTLCGQDLLLGNLDRFGVPTEPPQRLFARNRPAPRLRGELEELILVDAKRSEHPLHSALLVLDRLDELLDLSRQSANVLLLESGLANAVGVPI